MPSGRGLGWPMADVVFLLHHHIVLVGGGPEGHGHDHKNHAAHQQVGHGALGLGLLVQAEEGKDKQQGNEDEGDLEKDGIAPGQDGDTQGQTGARPQHPVYRLLFAQHHQDGDSEKDQQAQHQQPGDHEQRGDEGHGIEELCHGGIDRHQQNAQQQGEEKDHSGVVPAYPQDGLAIGPGLGLADGQKKGPGKNHSGRAGDYRQKQGKKHVHR